LLIVSSVIGTHCSRPGKQDQRQEQ